MNNSARIGAILLLASLTGCQTTTPLTYEKNSPEFQLRYCIFQAGAIPFSEFKAVVNEPAYVEMHLKLHNGDILKVTCDGIKIEVTPLSEA